MISRYPNVQMDGWGISGCLETAHPLQALVYTEYQQKVENITILLYESPACFHSIHSSVALSVLSEQEGLVGGRVAHLTLKKGCLSLSSDLAKVLRAKQFNFGETKRLHGRFCCGIMVLLIWISHTLSLPVEKIRCWGPSLESRIHNTVILQ